MNEPHPKFNSQTATHSTKQLRIHTESHTTIKMAPSRRRINQPPPPPRDLRSIGALVSNLRASGEFVASPPPTDPEAYDEWLNRVPRPRQPVALLSRAAAKHAASACQNTGEAVSRREEAERWYWEGEEEREEKIVGGEGLQWEEERAWDREGDMVMGEGDDDDDDGDGDDDNEREDEEEEDEEEDGDDEEEDDDDEDEEEMKLLEMETEMDPPRLFSAYYGF